MKRAFFVLGAQGSGTRMLTAAFIAAGCRGSAEHHQPMDDLDFRFIDDQPLVFRRSLPHGGIWPNLLKIANEMDACGYSVQPVWIHRKTDYVIAHQLRTDREHDGVVQMPYNVNQEQAFDEITVAYCSAQAFAGDFKTPLLAIPYEPFAMFGLVRKRFFQSLGLPWGDDAMTFYNANEHPRYSEVKALPW